MLLLHVNEQMNRPSSSRKLSLRCVFHNIPISHIHHCTQRCAHSASYIPSPPNPLRLAPTNSTDSGHVLPPDGWTYSSLRICRGSVWELMKNSVLLFSARSCGTHHALAVCYVISPPASGRHFIELWRGQGHRPITYLSLTFPNVPSVH